MKYLLIIAILFITGCMSIDANGEYCYQTDNKNCEVYIPVYTPTKLFIKSTIQFTTGAM